MIERVKKVLSDVLGVSEDKIGPDTTYEDVGAWDSLRQMDIILSLEDEFGVEFDPVAALNLSSVQAIMEALAEKGVS